MAIRYDDDQRRLVIGVRDLVEAGRDHGDLGEGLAARRRLEEGRAIHARHQEARRGEDPDFRAEAALSVDLEVDGWTCTVRGRLDGLVRRADGTVWVEEVKSVALPRAALDAVAPDDFPGHTRQLGLYLFLLAASGESGAAGTLVLVGTVDGGRRSFRLDGPPADVGPWTRAVLGRLVRDREAEIVRRAAARARLPDLPFPHPTPRPQQVEMSDEVARAVRHGRRLLLSAPTGSGKTAAVLHGVLRAAVEDGLKVTWVTARTPQREGVLSTLAALHARLPEVRAVGVRARERICPQPRVLCRASFCELARGYYDKMWLRDPLPGLVARGPLGPADFLGAGLDLEVCPYELTRAAAARVDVVVADYNHVFDRDAALPVYQEPPPWDDALLVVDEAHQLPERAMDLFSPVLAEEAVARARDAASRGLGGAPSRLLHLFDELQDEIEAWDARVPREAGAAARVVYDRERFAALKQGFDEVLADRDLFLRLRPETAMPDGDPVVALVRDLGRFDAVLDLPADAFRHLYERGPIGRSLRVLCVDPSGPVGRRVAGFRAAVFLSATLRPAAFYRDILGLPPDDTDVRAFPSPFPAENRRVLVRADVSTAWRDRERTAPRVAERIEEALALDPRAWLVFFPSFEYRDRVARDFDPGDRAVLSQSPRMDEGDREAVLDRLREPGEPGPVLLGVLGGIFAEGIDLPGTSIGGVVVVSPALPRADFARELVREHFEERFGLGFEYAYLYPGMNRVVQAAGRVVRSEDDRGTVVLVCRRFAEGRALALLPADWRVEVRER